MRRVRGSDNGGIQIRVAERESQDELHGRHVAEQVIEPGPLPPLPLQPPLPALRRRPLRCAAADHDTRSGCGRRGDDRLVFALHGRIRNLKDVEHAHGDVVLQMRQRARHADEPHLAGLLEFQHGVDGAVLFKRLLRRRYMELHQIEVVGLHPR
jgi:hypothetical protein